MSDRPRIPVNLITGFLGVGKTTAIRGLLGRSTGNERWALLVNEFGEVGVDGTLLEADAVIVREVAGGCLCCVAAPAFTTGLNQMIRRHRPDRILIEPSGLGHPAQVLETLRGPLYASVLDVRATVCLMDPRHLASPRHREHPNFQDQIHLADVLVANKRDLCSGADIRVFESFAAALRPTKSKLAIVERGWLAPDWLDMTARTQRLAAFPEAHAFLVDGPAPDPHRGTDRHGDWTLFEGYADGYHRAGWLIERRYRWRHRQLEAVLDTLPYERRKGVFRTEQGYLALNQQRWEVIAEPGDGSSRLEVIHAQTIDRDRLDRALRGIAIHED